MIMIIVVPEEPRTATNSRLNKSFDERISFNVRGLVWTIRGYTWRGNV